MNPEKEKAPEGAQVEQNHDTAMPDSQGFLEAKEWLGRQVHAARGVEYSRLFPWRDYEGEMFVEDAWSALVAVHGELSARLVLATKYDTVKGVRNG